jgi:Kip1 ubiquitination-promoting complex protein 1
MPRFFVPMRPGAGAATRRAFRADCAAAARARSWARASLPPAPLRADLFSLVSYTLSLLHATAVERPALFSYAPELYLEAPLEAFHALRRGDPPHPFAPEGTALVVRTLSVFCAHPRVANPGVRDAVLQSASVLLQYPSYVAAFEASPHAREGLLPALLSSFADSRFWIATTNVLLRLLHPAGAGLAPPRPGAGVPPAADVADGEGASPLYGAALRALLARDAAARAAFASTLLSTLAWTAGELSSASRELTDALSRQQQLLLPRAQRAPAAETSAMMAHLSRKVAIMFELSLNLCRLAHVAARAAPRFFLGGGEGGAERGAEEEGGAASEGGLSLARLAEGCLFLLGVVDAPSEQGAGAAQPPLAAALAARLPALERIPSASPLRAAAAAPLLSLFAAERAASAAATATPRSVVAALAAHDGAADTLRRASASSATSATLNELASAVSAAAAAAAAEEASLEDDARGGGGGVPDEFMDPLMATLMVDPVQLPSSGVILDRATIARHLQADATDPFSRAPLTSADLLPASALRERIAAWRKERAAAAAAAAAARAASGSGDAEATEMQEDATRE